MQRGTLIFLAGTLFLAGILFRLDLRRDRSPADWVSPAMDGAAPPAAAKGVGTYAWSLGLATAATALALGMAFPVGVWLGSRPTGWGAALTLVPAAMPPHLAAYVWRFTLEDAFAVLAGGTGLWRSGTGSFLGAAWTLAALYWPVIALPIAACLLARGNRLEEELATVAPPRAVFWRAVVPGLAPALALGSGVVFLFALSNYGVPLMWNLPSGSVAAFARLSAFFDPLGAARLALPLAATAAGVCLAGLAWTARRPGGLAPEEMERAARARQAGAFTTVAALLILWITVAAPVANMVVTPKLVMGSRAEFAVGLAPFFWGVAIAALGAAGATALGMAWALLCKTGTRRGNGGGLLIRAAPVVIEAVGLLALFLPPALLCGALAGLRSASRAAAWVYDGLGVFALAYGLRFFYIPWKLTRLAQRMESSAHEDAKRLLGLGPLARAGLAFGGVLRPAAAMSWLIVFALALGDLEIANFLVQPGRQTMGVFLDNLMHYGRSATVAQWSLVLTAAAIGVAWAFLAFGTAQWRKWRATA